MGQAKSCIKEKSDWVLRKKLKQHYKNWKRLPRRAVEFLSLEVSNTQVNTVLSDLPYCQISPALSAKLDNVTSTGPLKVQSFYISATVSPQLRDESQVRR